jgi:predicted Ser/Thr protein kinase
MNELHASNSPSALQILDLEFGHETGGMYHIRYRGRGGYMSIQYGTFDDQTMCMPEALSLQLPTPSEASWCSLEVSRSETTGKVEMHASSEPLAPIEPTWHTNLVDYFTLEPLNKFNRRVREVRYRGRSAIAKIARFPWEIRQIANESTSYWMATEEQARAGLEPVTPTVLGQLHENGRVIGLLFEKIAGRPADVHDLEACEVALRQLHDIGIEHGDLNRHNFIVDDVTGKAYIIDLERARNLRPDTVQRERNCLLSELAKNTGRGAGYQDMPVGEDP